MSTAATARTSHAAFQQKAVLALDIGGTTLKGAVVDTMGSTRFSHSVPTGTPGDGVMHRAQALLRALDAASRRQGLQPVAIGVATPGVVNADSGDVEYASSLGWTRMPVAEVLSTEFGLPVLISHDARAAGLAEARLLAPDTAQDSVFVAIGTGVGAAVITKGTAITGASRSAGELGHVPVIPDGERCACGQRGCLEAYFSGAGLVRRYRGAGGDSRITAAHIASGKAGDAGARVWEEGIRALALALATVTLVLDPETVIIGGGLSEAGDLLLQPLEEDMSSLLAWRRPPTLRRSLLGPRAGQIGAAILGFEAAGFRDTAARWSPKDVAVEAPSAPANATTQLSPALEDQQGHR